MNSKKYSVMRANVVIATIIEIVGLGFLFLIFSSKGTNPTVTDSTEIGFIIFNVFSLIMFIYFVIIFGGTVRFTKLGINKKLLWAFKKNINWNDVVEIAVVTLPRGSQFIFFSTEKITYTGKFTDIDRLRNKRSNIFLNASFINPNKGILSDINNFAPKELAENIKYYDWKFGYFRRFAMKFISKELSRKTYTILLLLMGVISLFFIVMTVFLISPVKLGDTTTSSITISSVNRTSSKYTSSIVIEATNWEHYSINDGALRAVDSDIVDTLLPGANATIILDDSIGTNQIVSISTDSHVYLSIDDYLQGEHEYRVILSFITGFFFLFMSFFLVATIMSYKQMKFYKEYQEKSY